MVTQFRFKSKPSLSLLEPPIWCLTTAKSSIITPSLFRSSNRSDITSSLLSSGEKASSLSWIFCVSFYRLCFVLRVRWMKSDHYWLVIMARTRLMKWRVCSLMISWSEECWCLALKASGICPPPRCPMLSMFSNSWMPGIFFSSYWMLSMNSLEISLILSS